MGTRTDRTGRSHQLRAFWFDAAVCGACPLKERCVGSGKGSGRTVSLHPQEALLQWARALQRSEGYSDYRQRRMVVEHRLARLVQLGVRQARYLGRTKTLFQLLMAATVANLTLVAGKVGKMGGIPATIDLWTAALSCRHLHSEVERHSGRAEWVVDPLLRSNRSSPEGFSSALLGASGILRPGFLLDVLGATSRNLSQCDSLLSVVVI